LQASTRKEDVDFQHEAQRYARAHASRALDRSGILIRTMSDPDRERILELRKIVRWSADPRAFGLLREMREARWAVAEDGPAVVGMVGAVPLGEVGILCHLAVRHDYRKLGLGSALSSWSVSYLRSRGAKVVRLDSTHGAKRLYESLGFESVSRRSVYRLEGGVLAARLRGSRSLDERTRGLRVTPLLFGDLPELYGTDRWSFGGDRSALIRATLNLHPGWGLIARDASGRINGYLVCSAYESTVRIGPFMASSPDVARVLLAHALQTDGGRSVEVSVPGSAESPAHGVLREFGFVGWWDRLRMELGEAPRANGLEVYGTTPSLAT
jgi:ribosomal protein S18 acetylase RimI-like enzyme